MSKRNLDECLGQEGTSTRKKLREERNFGLADLSIDLLKYSLFPFCEVVDLTKLESSCKQLNKIITENWEYYFKSNQWHLDFELGFKRPIPPSSYHNIDWKKQTIETSLQLSQLSFYAEELILFYSKGKTSPELTITPEEISQFEQNHNLTLPNTLKFLATTFSGLDRIGFLPISQWVLKEEISHDPLIINHPSPPPSAPHLSPQARRHILNVDLHSDNESDNTDLYLDEQELDDNSISADEYQPPVELIYGDQRDFSLVWEVGTSPLRIFDVLQDNYNYMLNHSNSNQLYGSPFFRLSEYTNVCKELISDYRCDNYFTEDAMKCLAVAGNEFVVCCLKKAVEVEKVMNGSYSAVMKEDPHPRSERFGYGSTPYHGAERLNDYGEDSDVSVGVFSNVAQQEMKMIKIALTRRFSYFPFEVKDERKLALQLEEYFKENPFYPQPGDVYLDRDVRKKVLNVKCVEGKDTRMVELDLGTEKKKVDLDEEMDPFEFLETVNSPLNTYCIIPNQEKKHILKTYSKQLLKWAPNVIPLLHQ
eukprot:TRINITY_DN9620_c0_g1_i1.p1 TRINITY_DN9620_c0_g1~~TRINITY_DN9620_c0_g1_i1.p1  ORF type:complete len:535 (-),score=182.36 TRINITY_DN9620_c0_g1_i1:3-1607(-)